MKKIFLVIAAATFLSACQSSSDGSSNSSSTATPENVLKSRAEVKSFLNDKAFEEYSNSLEVIMISKFGPNNRWTQAPLDRDDVFSVKISYEKDGRVCNLKIKNCFYVRPTFAGFDMINPNGTVGKSLELIAS